MEKTGIELEVWQHQSDSVRADDAQQIGSGSIEHLLPQAVFLCQAGCYDNGCPCPFLAKFAYQAWHGGCGRHDDGQFRHAGNVFYGPMTAQSANRLIFRVDWPDLTFKS